MKNNGTPIIVRLSAKQAVMLKKAAFRGLISREVVKNEQDEAVAEQLFGTLRTLASEIVDGKSDTPRYILCLSGHWHNTPGESTQCNRARDNENSKLPKI